MKQLVLIIIISCACLNMQAQENIIITIAGLGTAGYSGDDGEATNAKLNVPDRLFLDRFENLYIADAFNNRIRKVDLISGIISTVCGNDTAEFSGDGGPASSSQLYVPQGIITDTIDNKYIVDAGNNRIRFINIFTNVISTIAGSGPSGIGVVGDLGDGGPATNAQISNPSGLCIDKFFNLYISDYGNNKIRKINALTGIISTFAGIGTHGYMGGSVDYTGDGGQATAAIFSGPIQVFADNADNIFICDQWNHAIRKVDATTGIITTITGNGTAGHTGDGGLAVNATLNQPGGIFVDDKENIFIAEYGDGVIRKIDGATGIISTVAGTGTRGYSGDGGPATAAELKCSDVVVDKNGVIYIADIDNNRIRMVYNTAMGVGNVKMGKGENVQIYPNPVNDELNIENGANSDLIIYNLLGSELLETKLISNKEAVNIIQLTPGVYLVKIIGANGEVQNFRVVKE